MIASRIVPGEPDELRKSEVALRLAPPVGLAVVTGCGDSSISTHMPTEKLAVLVTWTTVSPCAASAVSVAPQLVGVVPRLHPPHPQLKLPDGDSRKTPDAAVQDALPVVTPQMGPVVVDETAQSAIAPSCTLTMVEQRGSLPPVHAPVPRMLMLLLTRMGSSDCASWNVPLPSWTKSFVAQAAIAAVSSEASSPDAGGVMPLGLTVAPHCVERVGIPPID